MTLSRTFHIRHGTTADAEMLADLGRRTFGDAFAEDNQSDDMERYLAEAFTLERVTAEIEQPGSMFLIGYDEAFDPQRPVGYARLLGGSTLEQVTGPKPVELVRIYVEHDAIGGGHGSALMRACLQTVREHGYETIWLGAWELNPRALGFYERWGFEAVGRRDFVIGSDVQKDLVMQRRVGDREAEA
ncbi:MAG: GNAT family N-acetyltransferase [bacterium]|nr:GNAT family N-acetyltransferase [bacterium]